MSAAYRPMTAVAGDFYDFIQMIRSAWASWWPTWPGMAWRQR